ASATGEVEGAPGGSAAARLAALILPTTRLATASAPSGPVGIGWLRKSESVAAWHQSAGHSCGQGVPSCISGAAGGGGPGSSKRLASEFCCAPSVGAAPGAAAGAAAAAARA